MTRIKKRSKTGTIYIYSSSDDQPASKSDALDDSDDMDGPELGIVMGFKNPWVLLWVSLGYGYG
jgi:hypothetical protein